MKKKERQRGVRKREREREVDIHIQEFNNLNSLRHEPEPKIVFTSNSAIRDIKFSRATVHFTYSGREILAKASTIDLGMIFKWEKYANNFV